MVISSSVYLKSGCMSVERSRRVHACLRTVIPVCPMCKLSMDAAFFNDSSQMGIGIIIRDEYGGFIVGKTVVIDGCLEVEEGEVMGLYEALSWIKDMDLQEVIVEGDAKIIYSGCNFIK